MPISAEIFSSDFSQHRDYKGWNRSLAIEKNGQLNLGKRPMELISEMEQCKTIAACHECAIVDANGEDEAALGWLTCIEEMFGKFEQVKVLGNNVVLEGFDLKGLQVVAKCRRDGRKPAFVSLESIEFPKLSENEQLWLDALKNWNESF